MADISEDEEQEILKSYEKLRHQRAVKNLQERYPEIPEINFRGVPASSFEKDDLLRILASAVDKMKREENRFDKLLIDELDVWEEYARLKHEQA